jgi:hypothetical protein
VGGTRRAVTTTGMEPQLFQRFAALGYEKAA